MKKQIIIASMLLAAFFTNGYGRSKVYYVKLSEGTKIAANPIQEYNVEGNAKNAVQVLFYPNIEFQTIEGIGGAFNEIGGVALMSLDEKGRKEVMSSLFGKEGAHFSFCRTAIGASDFGVNAYSYSEQKNDFTMKHFSIERERNSVIPYIKMAYGENPNLKMFASPWSPPGWMKKSGEMEHGDQKEADNHLIDSPEIYRAYALYMAKYVKAYRSEGININRIIVQNETDVATKYPSCIMPASQMFKFISGYMRPEFKREKLSTQIWAGTFRTPYKLDCIDFVSHKNYLASVDGIGIQYTLAKYISDMNALIGNKPKMHTESNCFNGKNSFQQAMTRLSEVANYINGGTGNFCYWNMILNETGKSGWDWKQNALINIDRNNKTITYNPDYAAMYIISKYLQPGAKRIATSVKAEEVISVKKDNMIYLLVTNDTVKDKNYDLHIGDKSIGVAAVPAESIAVIATSL